MANRPAPPRPHVWGCTIREGTCTCSPSPAYVRAHGRLLLKRIGLDQWCARCRKRDGEPCAVGESGPTCCESRGGMAGDGLAAMVWTNQLILAESDAALDALWPEVEPLRARLWAEWFGSEEVPRG